ncbi:MAG: glycosyltransferase [Candidatus Tyrphobacter sp.]
MLTSGRIDATGPEAIGPRRGAGEPENACKVSVIMPAFNESKDIIKTIEEVVETFRDFGDEFEVIVVDDGSPDNTYLHAARTLVDRPERVRIIRYDVNKGKGNALVAGVCCARGEYVVFLDADMDLHPRQLPLFFAMMESQGADAVIGSKWHPLSSVSYPRIRRLYSMGYYLVVRLLFGLPLRDTQTGLKLFKMTLLRDVFPRLLVKRFAFDIEVLAVAHACGYKIVDAPVALTFTRSIPRLRFRHVWQILVDTIAIFYRLRILRYYCQLTMPEVMRGIDTGVIKEVPPDTRSGVGALAFGATHERAEEHPLGESGRRASRATTRV